MAEVHFAREVVQENEDVASDVEVDSLDGNEGSPGDWSVSGSDVVNPDVTITELDNRLDDAIVSLQPHWQVSLLKRKIC